MEAILEIILAVFLDFIMPVFFELFTDFSIRQFTGFFDKSQESSFLPFVGYSVASVLCASLSLFIHPGPFITDGSLRGANLLVTPLVIGLLMSLRGKKLKENDGVVLRIDSFTYGWWFAFLFGLIRYRFAS